MPRPPEPRQALLIDDVGLAVERLRSGGLVAIPTETVYGLAADAEQPEAVERIFTVKGRPRTHPLIVHLADLWALDGWVGQLAARQRRRFEQLAIACWPGPLTVLVPRGPRVHPSVTGGRETVGLRVPAHPLTTALLEQLAGGVAAPSANRFGRVSPTSARHVLDDLSAWLDPRRDAVLDGGECPVGVESTIVDLTCDPPQLLRAGAISAAEIERILGAPIGEAAGERRASGMLTAHYAPTCRVLLAASRSEGESVRDALRTAGLRCDLLDRTDDLVATARQLYADLRHAEAVGLDTLVVVMPPAEGIGFAVRDRLTKAAAGSGRSSRAD